MKLLTVWLLIAFIFLTGILYAVESKADAVLHLSGTVPDKGYTIQNGYVIPHSGFSVTINGVKTLTKVYLTPNTDYKIVVEAL